MSYLPQRDQFVGCLLGQALGDALGFAVEGYGQAHCRTYVEEVLRLDPVAPLGRPPFAFGQYTDDTQLARELTHSMAQCGGFDAAHYAGLVAAIFTEERVVGRGRSTEAAALRLAAGVPWQDSGTPAPSAGNGSAMRAGPVGLLCYDDPAALAATAHDQGRTTHADPRCSAGAAMVAGTVAHCLRESALDRTALLAELESLAAQLDDGFAAELRRLPDWLALEPAQAAPEIANAGRDPDHPDDGWEGIAPFVVPSVLWSLYAFLRSPDDYWETICTAIAVGGDVDTTAAMAGAMSGARNGGAALPEDLTRRLNDRGAWTGGDLATLAGDLFALKREQTA